MKLAAKLPMKALRTYLESSDCEFHENNDLHRLKRRNKSAERRVDGVCGDCQSVSCRSGITGSVDGLFNKCRYNFGSLIVQMLVVGVFFHHRREYVDELQVRWFLERMPCHRSAPEVLLHVPWPYGILQTIVLTLSGPSTLEVV